MSTLAEIIEEGKRLEERYAAAVGMTERLGASAWRDIFYQKHGPRLLAVAEAAMEMRAVFPRSTDHAWVLAAFDAAASERQSGGGR